MPERTIRLDPRTAIPIAGVAIVVFVIIFLELCGREDVEPLAQAGPTATLGPTPTEGPTATIDPNAPTETPAGAGSAQRDTQRLQDLEAIQQALEQYFDQNGEYPSTGGAIQTLCAFEEFDEGCALKEALDPLPQEPLGNPGDNGYWYRSDGNSYTVFAQREADDVVAECEEHPDHLEAFDSVMCLSGPSGTGATPGPT
jgi:hypothetical protein